MKLLARFSGDGWLRAEGFGSATAAYEFTVSCDIGHARGSTLVTNGRLLSEFATMADAAARRWAILVLSNGKSVKMDIRSLSSDGMESPFESRSRTSLDGIGATPEARAVFVEYGVVGVEGWRPLPGHQGQRPLMVRLGQA